MADNNDIKASNASMFRGCLGEKVIKSLSERPRQSVGRKKREGKRKANKSGDAKRQTLSADPEMDNIDELSDFIEYLAHEIFDELPEELQTLNWYAIQERTSLKEEYPDPLPIETISSITDSLSPSISDSLSTYGLLNETTDLPLFLSQPLSSYIAMSTAPPISARHTEWASACEICERDWINLSYHHLIPREMHEKVIKRDWHPEYRLNDKASLCRQCHSMVHRIASNEELAREWYTIDLLKSREDVQKWARWLGSVRWKAR